MNASTPTVEAPRRRRGARAFVILGVVASLAIGAYALHAWWVRGKVSTDDAQVDADVVPLSMRVGGVATSVKVHDHEHVKAGEILLELDRADVDNRIAQAEADLDAARAQAEAADAQVEIVKASSSGNRSSAQAALDASGATVRGAAAQLASAQAAVSRAQSDLTRLDGDLAGDKDLAARGVITGSQLEATQTARDAASITLDQARAQLQMVKEQQRGAQARVDEARGKVAQTEPVAALVRSAEAAAHLARAKVQAAEAAVAQAKLVRSYTTLTAPIDGTISRLAVRQGQSLNAGQTVVMVVPEMTYVIANVKETDVARIHPGQKVDIEIDAFPDTELHGQVDSVAAATGARFSLLAPDNATGNFVKVVQRVPVKIIWTSVPKLELRPGLSAEVTIHTD